ncbi:hypothetical protein AFK69_02635 [Xenorhabdus sp. GDc328]|nr:hypothetical protein AAY47_17115 [Xenorhabdus griffiniae]KOP34790.1 hypothetical protein AFK69_02635 [Xenorhabdus sp. GDc328]
MQAGGARAVDTSMTVSLAGEIPNILKSIGSFFNLGKTAAKGAAKQETKSVAKTETQAAGKTGDGGGARIKGEPKTEAKTIDKPENHAPEQAKNTSSDKQGNNPEKTVGSGDPVDMATGDFLQVWPVIAIPGLLPLTYRSTAHPRGLFGPKWADDWSRQLALGDSKVRYTDATGVVYDYPTPDNTVSARNKHLPHCLLTGERDGALSLTDSQTQLPHHFNAMTGNIRRLSAITDRRQNTIHFHYDKQARLTAVVRNDGIRLVLDYQEKAIDLIDGEQSQRWVTCGYDVPAAQPPDCAPASPLSVRRHGAGSDFRFSLPSPAPIRPHRSQSSDRDSSMV